MLIDLSKINSELNQGSSGLRGHQGSSGLIGLHSFTGDNVFG